MVRAPNTRIAQRLGSGEILWQRPMEKPSEAQGFSRAGEDLWRAVGVRIRFKDGAPQEALSFYPIFSIALIARNCNLPWPVVFICHNQRRLLAWRHNQSENGASPHP